MLFSFSKFQAFGLTFIFQIPHSDSLTKSSSLFILQDLEEPWRALNQRTPQWIKTTKAAAARPIRKKWSHCCQKILTRWRNFFFTASFLRDPRWLICASLTLFKETNKAGFPCEASLLGEMRTIQPFQLMDAISVMEVCGWIWLKRNFWFSLTKTLFSKANTFHRKTAPLDPSSNNPWNRCYKTVHLLKGST